MNVAREKGFITFSVLKAANTKYNLLEKALFKKGEYLILMFSTNSVRKVTLYLLTRPEKHCM